MIEDANKSLTFHLHRRLLESQAARGTNPLHASDLTKDNFCAREVALSEALNRPRPVEGLNASKALVFSMGRHIQDCVVSWLVDAGVAVTNWVCAGCGHESVFTKRPTACTVCSTHHHDPVELRLVHPEIGVGAGFDMFALLPGDTKATLVETKTMAADEFKKLVAPLAEHRIRTSLYLDVLESSPEYASKVHTTHARVLYIVKGGYGVVDHALKDYGLPDRFSPFKEYTVQRNTMATAQLRKTAKTLVTFRDTGHLPNRVCDTPMALRAKSCRVVGECFGCQHTIPPEFLTQDTPDEPPAA